MSKLAIVFEDIMQLTEAERNQLLTNLQLQDNKTQKTRPMTREETTVYDALMMVCDSRLPYTELMKIYGRTKFEDKVELVYSYVKETRKFLRAPQTQALVALCFRCLANDMRKRGIPITPKILLDSIAFMKSAVDKSFPGYASAGLLHRLVDAA